MKLPTLRIAGTLALATTVLNGTSASALERQRARQVQAPSSIACTTVVEPVCARDKTETLRDYNNACEAERDGAIVIRKGRCAQSTVIRPLSQGCSGWGTVQSRSSLPCFLSRKRRHIQLPIGRSHCQGLARGSIDPTIPREGARIWQ